VATRERPVWGIFGGAFDPPHLGHVAVAAVALAAGDLRRLLVVPCFEHPFGKSMAPWKDRLAMARLAFAPLGPAVRVDPLEADLPHPSLTLVTVRALRAAHPRVRWRLVIGADTLRDRGAWHRFDEIAALAPPLVVGRAGHGHGDVGFPLPDLNSTEIRRALAAGKSVRGRLPAAVERYLRRRHLYGT
jgi:nicotinate-nucleotide adenylyltransferase